MSNLYMVATPIGNLGDITFRALETLKSVDIIACEDTRETLKLLNHFDISKKLISVRSQNEKTSAVYIEELLDKGKNIAYCSDAGTPCVSDPGAKLVEHLKNSSHTIIPIPGASALTSILSISDLSSKNFIFEGFLSTKDGKRKKRVQELIGYNIPFILYESPFRIVKLLQNISDIDTELEVIVGREMTKKFEEIIRGNVSNILQDFSDRKNIKGEFVILVGNKKK